MFEWIAWAVVVPLAAAVVVVVVSQISAVVATLQASPSECLSRIRL